MVVRVKQSQKYNIKKITKKKNKKPKQNPSLHDHTPHSLTPTNFTYTALGQQHLINKAEMTLRTESMGLATLCFH